MRTMRRWMSRSCSTVGSVDSTPGTGHLQSDTFDGPLDTAFEHGPEGGTGPRAALDARVLVDELLHVEPAAAMAQGEVTDRAGAGVLEIEHRPDRATGGGPVGFLEPVAPAG